MAGTDHTQVAIVGAGPAGLLLGRLLSLAGVDSVVLEARSRSYVENRVRAGLLEQGTVEALTRSGVGQRLAREALVQRGLEFRFSGRRHRIPVSELTGGRTVSVYGQQEVVKDLIEARLETGEPLHFETDVEELVDLETEHPRVHYRVDGELCELACDIVAGCDGYHGPCRQAIPPSARTERTREYPFGWLGILADAPPSNDEIVYAYHERGMALHSMRSLHVSRLYLQCEPDEDLADWPDDRIWDELDTRLAIDEGWTLNRGPILERGVTGMRSFVVEPMQYGRLYLAGDAAHIVPPTGAKGLNLAAADVQALAAALQAWYHGDDPRPLEAYSTTCLDRVWRAQHVANWMTTALHRNHHSHDELEEQLQVAQLAYYCSSRAGALTIAENYVGLDPIARCDGSMV